MSIEVTVVGAGLAGCEAAWQLARAGIRVKLMEMKPSRKSPAHISDDYAELVCSNSLRSNELTNAVGLLKEEMRLLASLIMKCADKNRIEAGGALAVDRDEFSACVTQHIKSNPLIDIYEKEVTKIPEGYVIIATGPLTSDAFAAEIARLFPERDFLRFYDAAAPIVTFESVNLERAFFASRYGKGTADYINCPMDKDEYISFWNELIAAEQAEKHAFEDEKVFEGCMPVEVMARRGQDTLRYGPLKPVGLIDPRTGKEPYGVVQLRRDNKEGSLYNIVGFQTNLKFGEQRRVFSMIPGLENAEFVRYGVMHVNTFIDSPRVLDERFRLRADTRIRFAGQITGVEGYVESAASGLLCGLETSRELLGMPPLEFSSKNAIGALAHYISNPTIADFQPMNINFGIMEPLGYRVKGKRNKNAEISKRSLKLIKEKLAQLQG
ncbi:MAG: methylenetetrahydrofolate--tRNA-(uracil(54)-C(5))-methyltransferase (FADH(2)-oxidizing) TrmFO [Clostridiales bacterium]|jgi:methylenetetrahydrofolate--tRNA-(uracil-5-)-methyltransferase|nr:methylenetetrahydrofolate--tRNA-(uracil(54)-C(5))-methyltransferase (FADH(2)-oxidizing) TrmFO [Clostridiales bacterium]